MLLLIQIRRFSCSRPQVALCVSWQHQREIYEQRGLFGGGSLWSCCFYVAGVSERSCDSYWPDRVVRTERHQRHLWYETHHRLVNYSSHHQQVTCNLHRGVWLQQLPGWITWRWRVMIHERGGTICHFLSVSCALLQGLAMVFAGWQAGACCLSERGRFLCHS